MALPSVPSSGVWLFPTTQLRAFPSRGSISPSGPCLGVCLSNISSWGSIFPWSPAQMSMSPCCPLLGGPVLPSVPSSGICISLSQTSVSPQTLWCPHRLFPCGVFGGPVTSGSLQTWPPDVPRAPTSHPGVPTDPITLVSPHTCRPWCPHRPHHLSVPAAPITLTDAVTPVTPQIPSHSVPADHSSVLWTFLCCCPHSSVTSLSLQTSVSL